MALLSGLLDAVPGYRGYRDKEDRRDADRRVRERVAAAFAAHADRVERVGHELATKRRIHDISAVNDLSQKIRHLVDRVSTASYGYGGLFSDRDVDEIALDQLRLFDESLLAGAAALDAPLTSLEQALANDGDLTAAARDGTTVVVKTLARFDLRNDMIQTGRAVPAEKIEDIISPKTAAAKEPPPAYNLHEGDAVEVLGDNFVVDARIDLTAPGQAVRLFRVDVVPDRWLLTPSVPGGGFALLQATNDAYISGAQSTIGETAYTLNWSAAGSGTVVGKGGATGSRPATISQLTGAGDAAARAVVIDWGNERQVMVGKEVHPGDIETFGATRG